MVEGWVPVWVKWWVRIKEEEWWAHMGFELVATKWGLRPTQLTESTFIVSLLYQIPHFTTQQIPFSNPLLLRSPCYFRIRLRSNQQSYIQYIHTHILSYCFPIITITIIIINETHGQASPPHPLLAPHQAGSTTLDFQTNETEAFVPTWIWWNLSSSVFNILLLSWLLYYFFLWGE